MLLRKFRRQIRPLGTSGSGAPRVIAVTHVAELDVPRLRHEAIDHAMESHIVIGPLPDQRLDLLHMFGGQVGSERNRHVSVLERNDHGVFRVGCECSCRPDPKAGENDEGRG